MTDEKIGPAIFMTRLDSTRSDSTLLDSSGVNSFLKNSYKLKCDGMASHVESKLDTTRLVWCDRSLRVLDSSADDYLIQSHSGHISLHAIVNMLKNVNAIIRLCYYCYYYYVFWKNLL
jgi:hypothetical protein